MNDILPTPINEKRIARVFTVALLLLCLLPIVINITCLTPLYFNLENNTVYRGTAITVTLKYISDLFDLISFSSVYAMIIFSLVLLKKRVTATVCISYCAILILKIPARLLMNIPLYGSIGTKTEIIADLISLSFYFIIELVQLALVFTFASVCSSNYLRSVSILNGRGKKDSRISHILPIKKYVDWYNPLLRSAIYSSITVTAFRFIARLITDIDAGLPSSFGEVMIIIINYLTDAVYGFVAYIIAIILFNFIYEGLIKSDKVNKENAPEDKNKADENNSSALFED